MKHPDKSLNADIFVRTHVGNVLRRDSCANELAARAQGLKLWQCSKERREMMAEYLSVVVGTLKKEPLSRSRSACSRWRKSGSKIPAGVTRRRKRKNRMKRNVVTLLILALCLLLSHTAFAQSTGPVTCSGPPVATGTAGSKSASAPNPSYIASWGPWSGEPYSMALFTNFGGPSKLSVGSPSDMRMLVGASCVTSGGACLPNGFPSGSGRITTIFMQNVLTSYGGSSTFVTRVMLNGLKAFELLGVSAGSSIVSSTNTFSDGISVIRQDTGVNSRFYVEGYHNGVWKSVPWKVVSPGCGSVAMVKRLERSAVASVGFSVMPEFVAQRQWWQDLG